MEPQLLPNHVPALERLNIKGEPAITGYDQQALTPLERVISDK